MFEWIYRNNYCSWFGKIVYFDYMRRNDEKILAHLLSGKSSRRYEGKQVVICEGEVFILPEDDRKAKEFFNKLIIEHPKVTPTITFVPKHGTYILISKK